MSAKPFDTLAMARALRDDAGFDQRQAEGVANAVSEALSGVATRNDIATLKADIQALEERLTDRLTVRTGAMIVTGVAALAAMKFFG